jgi:hypothetical protein
MRMMRFVACLALPVGILLLSGVQGVNAQSDEARQACTPDAMRLCSEFIPDAGRVKRCMLAKRGQLSQACRSAMRGGGGVRGHHRGGTRHRKHTRHHR